MKVRCGKGGSVRVDEYMWNVLTIQKDQGDMKGCISRRIEGKGIGSGSGIGSLLDQSRIEVLGRSEGSGV